MAETLDERETLLSKKWQSLMEVVDFCLDLEDRKAVQAMEIDKAVDYVYDRLLHDGYDPDETLKSAGVI